MLYSLLAIPAAFIVYVATRPRAFHYEASGDLLAPVEKVFPYLSDLKLGSQWSPYERMDPNMKKDYVGTGNQVGSKLVFSGNSQAGTGSVEIMKIVPGELVELKLTMSKPMKAEHKIVYQTVKTDSGTKFTWSMSGEGGFVTKFMSVVMSCTKMLDGQFAQGIKNLKEIVEK